MKSMVRTARHRVFFATLLLSGVVCFAAAVQPTINTVRVELLAQERGSKFQIFYNIGAGYNEKDSSSADYVRADTLQTIYLKRPTGQVRGVRLDPLTSPGEVRIKSIAIGHRPLWGLGPVRIARVWSAEEIHRSFATHRQVEAIALEGGMVTIKSAGTDPRLFSNRGTDVPAGGGDGARDRAFRLRMKLFDAALLGGVILLVLAGCAGLVCLLRSRPWLLLQAARLRAQTAFVWLSLPFGLFFVFLTPPLQAPDEQIHLFRSYQLATLDIFKPNDIIPEGLIRFLNTYQPMIFHPETKTGAREIIAGFRTEIDPSITTKHYTTDLVLPYLPQALGVLAGKVLGGSPLVMLLLGRLFNLGTYIILVRAAIRIAPVFKWTLLLIATMPICVFLAGSLSYDPPTIGTVFLFLATVLGYSHEESPPLDPGRVRLLFLLAWSTAFMKLPYCLVAVTFLLLPVRKFGTAKRYWLVFVALICSTLLMTQVWSLARAAAAALGLIHPDAAPVTSHAMDQLNSLMAAPLAFAQTFLNTVRFYWQNWLDTMIGSQLGWLDTGLPAWVPWLFYGALPALALSDSDAIFTLRWHQRLLLVSVVGVGFTLIPTLLYIFEARTNPVGAKWILGVQGRYFIPFLPYALLLLSNRALAARETHLRGAAGLAAVSVAFSGLVAATVSLVSRYYG